MTLKVTAIGSAQAESPIKYYQPTIDITKNPHCGKKLNTPAERIAHNRKLAELYFVNFQQDRINGRNWNWAVHDCVAEGATVLLGVVDPLAEARPGRVTNDEAYSSTGMGRIGRNPTLLSGEQKGYFATFPDWQTVPGSLVVVPFDGGAYFRMMYAGTGKDDGKKYSIWETNLILTNDEGKITHFEMWNDTMSLDATTRKAFGHGLTDVGGIDGYIEATEKAHGPAAK